jgi:hypothetical protein
MFVSANFVNPPRLDQPLAMVAPAATIGAAFEAISSAFLAPCFCRSEQVLN